MNAFVGILLGIGIEAFLQLFKDPVVGGINSLATPHTAQGGYVYV